MGTGDSQGRGARYVAEGILTREDLERALKESGLDGTDLGAAIGKAKTVTNADLAAFMDGVHETPVLPDLREVPFASNASQLIPEKTARRHTLVPLCRVGNILFVAIGADLDAAAADALRTECGGILKLVEASGAQVKSAIEKVYLGSSVDIPAPGDDLSMAEVATDAGAKDEGVPFISGGTDEEPKAAAPAAAAAAPAADPVSPVKAGQEDLATALKNPHAKLVFEFDQTFLGSDEPADAQLQL